MRPDHEIDIEVMEGVYPPSEDSYLLLSAVDASEDQRVLEVGTGTGIIALHCAKAGADIVAADISLRAVRNARANARKNNRDVKIVRTDLLDGLRGEFDLILFNPPYLTEKDSDVLSNEQRTQTVGGALGGELTARFLDELASVLSEEGRALIVTSSESSSKVLKHAARSYTVKKVAGEEHFFETLAVYELRSLKGG